ncbi:interleukin-19-like [Rhinoderma darwinii]|uniref:interleukin-19-like n=1 Tax=Rhinoderma darwinii TaxID=43563 RepID=UPI003F66B5B9
MTNNKILCASSIKTVVPKSEAKGIALCVIANKCIPIGQRMWWHLDLEARGRPKGPSTQNEKTRIAYIMQSAYSCFYIVVVGVMLMKMPSSEAENICPLSQDMLELKRYFEVIKKILHDNDKITNIRLLKESTLNKIHPSERCCFLLKLGTFYVTNIFPQLELNTSKMHRKFTHLANSMLSLKIELKHCHATNRCPCGEQAHTAMEEFKNDYCKMETPNATLKAIGEMNTLFHWIEKNFEKLRD